MSSFRDCLGEIPHDLLGILISVDSSYDVLYKGKSSFMGRHNGLAYPQSVRWRCTTVAVET